MKVLLLQVRRAAALSALAWVCAGCSPLAWGIAGGAAGLCAYAPSRFNHAYQTTYQPAGLRVLQADTADVRIGFVEFDDFGWMRDTMQARALLDELQALHARTNVAVLVYAHGWRHNAKDSDADVAAFKATLKHLAQQLDEPDLRSARASLTGDPAITMFGIYVGWRGKAWPEVGRWLPYVGPVVLDLPVYLTSPGRKSTAGVVGTGDVKSFLLRLDDMHREINDSARVAPRRVKPLGLVYVGHSYGGHLMFSALGPRLEDQMGTALAGSVARDASGLASRMYPMRGEVTQLQAGPLVDGVGDLVVLVNPAIEASAYRRIDRMVRTTQFASAQLPRMVTVSAENDGARKGVFGVMRFVQLFGRSKSKQQSALESHAFGSYEPQVTHQLELTRPDDLMAQQRARRKVIEGGRDQLAARRGDPLTAGGKQPQTSMTASDLFATREHGVVRMRSNDGLSQPRPAIVVRSSRQVIDKHSDFFRAEFIDWLTDYVLTIERVRLGSATGGPTR